MPKQILKSNLLFSILFLLISTASIAQVVKPFAIRYQTTQKGGIVYLANVVASCSSNPPTSGGSCQTAANETPTPGTGVNNDFNQVYVDIDGDASTFQSSSDSLALPNCSQITWAGLYWGAMGNAATTPTRNNIKIKVNNGSYQSIASDVSMLNTTGYTSYHNFKDITSIVQAAGTKARFTVANVPFVNNGSSNNWGSWSIVVVYGNQLLGMRQLTVFDGLANVSGSNTVNVPISGFLTPPTGPVDFELGTYVHDGDRSYVGDQMLFSGNGGPFVNVSDALNGSNDVFNSTVSNKGVLTPYRIPNMKNTMGLDADIFEPINTTKNYLSNSNTSATLKLTTGGETYLVQEISTAIDVFEPDLRVDKKVFDRLGNNMYLGTVAPGDTLTYRVTVYNIGSDSAFNTFVTDSIPKESNFVPGSIRYVFGPNSGTKTDGSGDDQAEFNAGTGKFKFRIGLGANSSTGGKVSNSSSGLDSTVLSYKVTASGDCMILKCNNRISNRALVTSTGKISGNTITNGSNPAAFDAAGCPIAGSTTTFINVSLASCVYPPDTTIATLCPANQSLASLYTRPGYDQFYNSGFTSVITAVSPGIYYAIRTGVTGCTDTVAINVSATSCTPINISNDCSTLLMNTSKGGNMGSNNYFPPSFSSTLFITSPIKNASHGSFTINSSGVYNYTPSVNFTGKDTVVVSYCGVPILPIPNFCFNDTLFVTVIATSTVVKDNAFTTQDAFVNGNINTNNSHPNGGTFVADTVLIKAPSHGVIDMMTNGDYTYTPMPNFFGRDTVITRVCVKVVIAACTMDTVAICKNDTLVIKVIQNSISNISICSNEFPYTWNGDVFLAIGNYSVHILSPLGYDSVATLNLSLKPTSTSTTSVNVCSSSLPYVWNANSYNVAGTYVVHFTNSVGCDSAATLVLTTTTNLTDGGIIGSNETACNAFDPANITSISLPSGGGPGIIEYIWLYNLNGALFNNGSNGWILIPGANGPSYDPGVITQNTNFIRCARRNGCGPYIGESNVVTKIILSKPTANFTINNPTQCGSNNFIFINTSVNNTSNEWHFGDNTTASTIDATKSYITNGSYSVKLIVTNANGCKDSTTKQVSLSNPTASFTYTNKCNGVIEFQNTSINANDYEWIFSNASYCTNSLDSFNRAFTSGTQTVSLVARKDGGCADTFTQTITILPNPIAIFSAYAIGCTKEVRFSNFSVGASNYHWDFGVPVITTDTSNLQNPTFVYPTDGTYTVKLIATTLEGCRDTLNTQIVVNSVGVMPTAAFTINNLSSTCVNRFSFTNTSLNAVSYQWIFSDGSSVNSVNANKSFGSIGVYQVMLVAKSATNCFDTIVQNVNVTSGPNGVIASFVPNQTQSCLANNNFEFNNTSYYVGSGWVPQYEWDFGNGTINNVNSFIFNKHYDSSGIYTVRLIATGSDGCKDTAYQTIEVLPSPHALFTAFTNCGMTAAITNTTTGNAVAYIWDFGDNTSSNTTSLAFNHTFAVQNWYNIYLTAIGANGCKDYAAKTIIASMGQLPTALFSYDTIACSGAIRFKNISSGAAEFSWNFGDGSPTFYATNPIKAFAVAGDYNVTLTASNGDGCTTTYSLLVHAPSGANLALPKAGFTYSIGACNNNISANDSSDNTITRNWYFDGVLVGSNPWLNIPNPAAGYHELKLVVMNGACADSISKFILTQPSPTGTFSFINSNCSRTVLFNSNTVNGNTFKWKFNDILALVDTAIGSIASHTFTVNGDYIVNLEVTNLAGCTTIISDTVTINVSNNPLNASFYTNSNNCNCICSNKVKFVNNSSGNANSYIWNFGDGNTSTQVSPNKGYAHPGFYTASLTVSDTNGCISVATAQVFVHATAKGSSASFTTDNPIQCLVGNSFNFTNTSSYLGAGWNSKYYWSFGDGTIDSVNTFIFNKHYSTIGTYTVQLVAVGNDNCKDTMTMIVQVKNSGCFNISAPVDVYKPNFNNFLPLHQNANTSINNTHSNANAWTLYPNPSNGSFTITNSNMGIADEVEIIDILGRKINAIVTKNYTEKKITINCQLAKTGNYFLIINNTNGEKTRLKFNITE